MSAPFTELDQLCINAIRTLSIDAIQAANSGHPGLPMGAAPMAYVLWQRHLKFDPSEPAWADRDRFVLSAGHGSMLQYALLHLYGFDLPMEELKNFRQWDSRTPGHPEYAHTVGVEATTGPLGQGSANVVGMALAESFLAQRYNAAEHNVVNHTTYALVSDGDLMEGLNYEATSLAAQLGLGKLIYLYDANDISLDGPTSLAFDSENVAARYEALGWHVQTVADGDNDLAAIDAAITAARAETAKPSLILVKTTIGYGSPNKAGSSSSHGAPLGEDEVRLTKEALGWPETEPFAIPAEVLEHTRAAACRGREAHDQWKTAHAEWGKEHPDLAAQWTLGLAGLLPNGWDEDLPEFEAGSKLATRESSGKVLNALAERLPWFFGGDADLSSSTKTRIASSGDFHGGPEQSGDGPGRNVRYGVREHAMAAIANGIAYHGGLRTYTATFFCFADYMRPSMRLAAMNHLPVIHVFTHDSIHVGEDGPTHQPVEHLASLRSMPNTVVLRPADANETRVAWQLALERVDGPTSLVLTRQKIASFDRSKYGSAEGARRGAYVLREDDAAEVTLIATGSEVEATLAAAEQLSASGTPARVVSMPSWELFAEQDSAYRNEVLRPDGPPRVSVETGASFGWERWVGDRGLILGLDRFGASAPGGELAERFGFGPERIVERVRQHLAAQG